MNSLQILSFVGFTLLVAVITWWKVRKTDTGSGNDSNLLIVFYVQIMPDDFVMQLHRF